MNFLSVEGLSRHFGERVIFDDISFGLNEGDKVALVARNGTGKSTLMRILAGLDIPDSGRVVFNKDITVGYLSQDHGLDESATVIDNLFASGNAMISAIRAYESAMESGTSGAALQQAMDDMDRHNAWDYESKARQILGKLDIHSLNRVVGGMSGGEKRRVALAKVLIAEPDLLLLDEPTNHLDLDMTEWLEEYMSRSRMTLLMVTHDRYFLEVVCDEIFEIDNLTLYRYRGSFSYFLEKKAERESEQDATLERAQNLMRRELEWIRKSPKARTTKNKARVDRWEDVKAAASGSRNAGEWQPEINIERLGSKTVELHKVRKSWPGTKVLDGFDYVFQRNERVGVAGRNGVGKTTLLNLVTGAEEPDSGKVTIGETIVFGYFTQEGLIFKDGQKVIDAVREIADYVPLAKGQKLTAEQLLERFMFPRSRHYDFISKLSGGEKRRLHLLRVLMRNPNFLILDEPTNDLDIYAMAALEEYLVRFPGCLLVVSHDRYFLDKVADHTLILTGNGEVKDILGSYTQWRTGYSEARRAERVEGPKPKLSTIPKPGKGKTRNEANRLETEISELELQKKELESSLAESGSMNYEQIAAQAARLHVISVELVSKTEKWFALLEDLEG